MVEIQTSRRYAYLIISIMPPPVQLMKPPLVCFGFYVVAYDNLSLIIHNRHHVYLVFPPHLLSVVRPNVFSVYRLFLLFSPALYPPHVSKAVVLSLFLLIVDVQNKTQNMVPLHTHAAIHTQHHTYKQHNKPHRAEVMDVRSFERRTNEKQKSKL